MSGQLGKYEGREVVSAAIALRNAGDGLSKAMGIAPTPLRMGQRVQIIVEAVVDAHTHKPLIKDDYDGPYQLVAGLRADAALIVENATVGKLLDKHKAALNRAKEIEGQRSIEDETDE